MWLYWCLLSTIISGFTSIALKKCSNNDSKQIAIAGLLLYHLLMIVVSLIAYPQFLTQLNIIDFVKMLPGILLQSAGFYCAIASVKYGKISITSSIKRARVVITFLLGIIILKENCTILQLIFSIILIILSIIIAKSENNESINKSSERKAVLYSWGFVFFNGTSSFLNKIYVADYQNPLYVVFTFAVATVIGVLIYCLLTKQWNYIDIRKINNKKYFILQSLLDVSSSIFNRLSLLDGNVSITSVINSSSIVITLIAARFILKEKLSWQKYIMIFGITICVFILAIL